MTITPIQARSNLAHDTFREMLANGVMDDYRAGKLPEAESKTVRSFVTFMIEIGGVASVEAKFHEDVTSEWRAGNISDAEATELLGGGNV